MSGPTAGGTPIRIYGTGFGLVNGNVDVEFDNVNATDFQVIDDTLITAIVPAAAGGAGDNNTFADVEVTVTGSGTDTWTDGFFYTNATFTVAGRNGASSPYGAGDDLTTTLDGYAANTYVVVPQFNPLLVYIENFPEFDPPVPPPYTEILHFDPQTDGNGDLTDSTIELANPFDGTNNGGPYDANIACPVNQTTADYLGNSASISLTRPAYSGKCMVANGQYGSGMLERAIDMDNDPTPGTTTLVPSVSSVNRGSFVTVSGVKWNANPFFGSSRFAGDPGETAVSAKFCSGPTTCSTTLGNVQVVMTRYIYNNGTSSFAFSGATLNGGIQAGMDLPSPCTTCFIRVTQDRPAGGSIVVETAVNIN